ncbi:MAG: choice-of-anchor W domain-containing protein [Cyanophyceae cyanobacterium]
MQAPKAIISVTALALGLTIGHTAANAASFTPLQGYSDADFNADKDSGQFMEDWVAEGRIGNNKNNGDYEFAIVDWNTNDSNQVVSQQQYQWTSGQEVPFSVKYDGNTVEFNIAGKTLTPDQNLSSLPITETGRFPNGLNSIFLRAASFSGTARSKTTQSSSVVFSDLKVEVDGDETTYNGSFASSSSSGDSKVNTNYLLISDLEKPFDLKGNVSFSWEGEAPLGSRLAFQAKGGFYEDEEESPTPVPEPATMSLLSLGVIGLGMSRRRKQA